AAGSPADAAADTVPGGRPAGHPDGDEDTEETEEEAEADPVVEPEPLPETRSEHPLASYMLRVNGTERPVTDAWLGESLLYVLRERLGLAGAKDGCEQGECGACSVQVDGRLVASCLVPAATAAGSEVRTVEGLTVDGRPSDVQCALAGSGAVQCGFCIPGMAMTVHDLLEGNHKPTDLDIRQALSGNLCRCSGYRGVIDAVREVVTARDTDDDPAFSDETRVPHQGGPGPQGGAA
ncbi:Aerobic-type carbon monoxide dehydrogenase, small subunit, CoxS/CutS family, partial [Streptomyces sp. DvalAA-14]|uniref:(2Fe-2S)-binding protein n=1 Tax=unclassified Streptomyces TaxID=2593676 RepID=UPI00081B47DD